MVPDLTKKERKPMGINLRLTDLYKGADGEVTSRGRQSDSVLSSC